MITCSMAYIVLVNCYVMFRFTEKLALEAGLALALDRSMFILEISKTHCPRTDWPWEKWKENNERAQKWRYYVLEHRRRVSYQSLEEKSCPGTFQRKSYCLTHDVKISIVEMANQEYRPGENLLSGILFIDERVFWFPGLQLVPTGWCEWLVWHFSVFLLLTILFF